MTRHSSGGQQSSGLKQKIFNAAANFVHQDDYCTLILDRMGRILSCGVPAEEMFGASQAQLIGRLIADFVADLFHAGSSPSYSARYLGYLCGASEWRRFEARDVAGQALVVELSLVLMATVSPDREMFLLNVRRPERAAGLQA